MKRARKPKPTQSSLALEFASIDREIWMAQRLGEHGRRIFDGVTDPAIRKERFRTAVGNAGPHRHAPGLRKMQTYAELFERLYGEPLEPKERRSA